MKAYQPAVLIAAWLSLNAAQALQLYTEEYPPLSFSHEGHIHGLAPEVVSELLKRLDRKAEIHVVPWSRAYHSAQNNPDTAAFVTMRTAEREPLFKWVGPIMVSMDSFYALKTTDISIRNDQELAQIDNIAVPRDWFSYQELHADGMKNLLGVTEPAQMFHLLRQGRVKLILADNLSFHAQGNAAPLVGHLSRQDVKAVYPYRRAYGYISFWKGTDDNEIERWQKALDEMKRDGTFRKIYQRWLPGEEVPGLRSPSPVTSR
ncbi:ABC transporter substrate-binding protein [Ectopseudomonas mendocina]|uniref:ABC transporter substrate-binding protein n=1 Tax=Ectopseudomonas mendocina TaxID=300 RepID=A0ABZ2RDV5_ECTME